jgi:NAD(P)-dependent dehydrogenase (short-subunit alcohol dehydrogenase family)
MAAISDPLTIKDPAISKGSWVLVTGINGYIGSHIGDQLLGAGYKVCGAVRSLERAKWLFDLFEPYGKENFKLIEIPDMTAEGALDNAVKGELPKSTRVSVGTFATMRLGLTCIIQMLRVLFMSLVLST